MILSTEIVRAQRAGPSVPHPCLSLLLLTPAPLDMCKLLIGLRELFTHLQLVLLKPVNCFLHYLLFLLMLRILCLQQLDFIHGFLDGDVV